MKQLNMLTTLVTGLTLGLAACGGSSGGATATTSATNTVTTGTTTGTTAGTTTGSTSTATTSSTVDASKLPIGDGKFTRTTPAVGYVYACYAAGAGGASSKGPWFNADGMTWNSLSKISVQGAVSWASSFLVTLGSTLGITGNGLPPNATGTFPIASTDPAYVYDRNPNSIS
ncbi:MAG: hypothetical protein HYR68_13920, partial [Burkholderiales bacterium]|nr:hypothetical protein [Burkholderiales bacterium]